MVKEKFKEAGVRAMKRKLGALTKREAACSSAALREMAATGGDARRPHCSGRDERRARKRRPMAPAGGFFRGVKYIENGIIAWLVASLMLAQPSENIGGIEADNSKAG